MRVLALLIASVVTLQSQPEVLLEEPTAPPAWALAERLLLEAASGGVEAFAERYTDERGYLKCVERWGGNDGADDAMENFGGWTLLYALGGDRKVVELYKKAWEGHLRQYSEARAPGIEMAEQGMYWREFITSFDWEHTGEALAAFHLYGLSRPDDPGYRVRMQRFADFYTGDDLLADNYDREQEIIKSLHNGSRGAKLTPAREMDWGGLTVEGAPERLSRYSTASNIRGDHPLNLCATALGFNAFALTDERRYRDWVLEYASAWRDRVLENAGNIPTNIGLDGTIGGEWGGKWYGGVFGLGLLAAVRRSQLLYSRTAHCLGSRHAVDGRTAVSWSRFAVRLLTCTRPRRRRAGRVLLPRKHGDDGWYGYTPNQHLDVQRDVYLFTFDRQNLEGLQQDPWIRYLDGKNPGYPLEVLRADIETVRSRVSSMRSDTSIDYERPSDLLAAIQFRRTQPRWSN